MPNGDADSGGGFLSKLFSGKEGGFGKIILGALLGVMVSLLFGGGFDMMTGLFAAGGAISGALSGGTGASMVSGLKDFFGGIFNKKSAELEPSQGQAPAQQYQASQQDVSPPPTPARDQQRETSIGG